MLPISEDTVKNFVRIGSSLGIADLIKGTAGNISIRDPNERSLIITAHGSDLANLSARDLVEVDPSGRPDDGQKAPSTETPMHRAIYLARSDVHAIVHTHSIFATTLAATRRQIPAFLDEMTYVVGGPIAVAEYGFPGSPELSRNAVVSLADKQAVLLANHGVVGVGDNLDEALRVCQLVETVAQVFVYANLLGGLTMLDPQVVEKQMAVFRRTRGSKQSV